MASLDNDGSILVEGLHGQGNDLPDPSTVSETHLLWNSRRSIFQAGTMATANLDDLDYLGGITNEGSAINWDDLAGDFSAAFGFYNKPLGQYSFTSGYYNMVSGKYAVGLGALNTASAVRTVTGTVSFYEEPDVGNPQVRFCEGH